MILSMKFLFLILCFSASLYVASALSSDGLTLLSLLKHWTSVSPSINSSWKASDSTPCSWLGVECDHDSHVVSLNLTLSSIFGQLGSEIGNLNRLYTLELSKNGLSGTIPLELGNCILLEHINLSNNSFSGRIPYSLKNLQNLRYLSFYSNHLTGGIPEFLFQIPHLEEVYLYYNNISGHIPSNIGNMTELSKLYLSGNHLSGIIPSSIGNCSKLKALFLDGNRLEGVLPQSLNNLKNLTHLDVSHNNFMRSPLEFECNLNLIYMAMSNSNISGTIPSSLGNCTNLGVLYLSMNSITGLIPSELGNLVKLYDLDLAHNNLEGTLPQQLSNCTGMGRFDVGFNSLNGSLPSSLSSWKRLQFFILSENHFSGGIPSFLSEFDLSDLQLGGNMFGGKIPTSIGAMKSLVRLNMSANGITGEIPLEFGNLNMLQSLDVSQNNLTGDVPLATWMLQNLHSLDLSLNNFTGTISFLEELNSLVEVNLSYNSFVGVVPQSALKYLDSSPMSFMDIPGVCVLCPDLDGLSGTKTFYLKSCGTCKSKNESTNHKHMSKFVILIIGIGSSLFVSLLLVKLARMYLSCQTSKEKALADNEVQKLWSINDSGDHHRVIDLRYKREVMKATENLNDQYIIGRGGSGIVYKAKLDSGVLAVKKIEVARSERKRLSMAREIETIKKILHQNVVRFLGSWIGKDYGLIFYRFMENGSLHDVLHENNPPPSLDWNTRYKIAIGVAKGLAFLHEECDPPILHRDIKPKNILLDSDMDPYIADFGIALTLNQSSTTMNLRSTYHLGTRGFMAPEIAYTIVPSGQSDVYSYGVVLLELLTRKKVLDSSFEAKETTLVGWFKSVWRGTREIEEIVDSGLASELSDINIVMQVMKVLLVALICTQTDPGKRLKMKDIIEFFEAPTDPGIFVRPDRSTLATAATSIFMQGLASDTRTKSVLQKDMGNKKYFVERVKRDNEVTSMNKQGKRTDMSKTIQPIINISGAYDGGKQLLTADQDYSHTKAGYASPSPNYPPSCVQRTYGSWYMDSHPPHYRPHVTLYDVLQVRNLLTTLKWNVRYKIVVGIAHKLAYLHHQCDPLIVHRNINSKNILVDSEMEPHISDSGVSKLLNQPSTSTSEPYTRLAPREGALSDIFNYGVVLLELITRKKVLDLPYPKNTTCVGLVKSVWLETGNLKKIVDLGLAKELNDSSVVIQVTKVLCVALLCTENDPQDRPAMKNVIHLLTR